ncbi:UDP-N-acetylmuramoyl-L-alanyl-D-glutamate--2,6-diaminopimelate ligase [Candidatus Contubernalis alkaliaceticus]|uniref:UDP-N-acetylmuramoyl-L-alanyl-D-glutamate--2, 6-diaminopimelate ligase n=1 Tax=Candidatus Contubernalis alkaliaceticus TaxID=338645 RepID=UPI001F4C3FE6|nr:UDP-N-acetylmuramoyl-L-alanyl-D-glutamate--2,6-diaminopimelate ligase [Candidatus Contubernalis alkalaceticus]UNC91383.1 UDP-N-acetylmuramoyl-L-alanyl-D-glutamate--2,6-diaminopimelate ligase [Candidatus Contubernalis alkalaceticus]
MRVREIVNEVKPVKVLGYKDIEVTDITNHSARVKPGALFICVSGYTEDGHLYAEQAVKKGAAAVITERKLNLPVTQLLVKDSRLAQALAVQKYFHYPSSRLNLVGITGTNGKTTISYLTEAIFRQAGHKTGLIGTINYKIHDLILPAVNTTPDSIDLGRLFCQMLEQKIDTAVLEVSSHALEMHRVTGCDFNVSVFSNLTRDHFDLHQNLSNYVNAKKKLFQYQSRWGHDSTEQRYAVINIDDPHSSSMLAAVPQKVKVITYGFNPWARIRVEGFFLNDIGSVFKVSLGGKIFTVELKLPGLFNIYNALASLSVGLCYDFDFEIMIKALSEVQGIPGRFQSIECGQDFRVIVDFAHNPDALLKLLTFDGGNNLTKKILVFGCEGGKDQGKRKLMGVIAARNADYCIITCDNVNHEDPIKIAGEIEEGILEGGMNSTCYRIILDRQKAIEYALELACSGDIVIIAGKGHETKQVIAGQEIPFCDQEVVKDLLTTTHWV